MSGAARYKEQTGAAVVEFAILLILLLMLLLGIFEFGFLWLQNNYIANAAREGARVASKAESSEDDVKDAIKDYLKGIYPDDKVENDCCTADDFIEIVSEDSSVVAADGTTVYTMEVTVTVQTDEIWDPMLWDFVTREEGDITEISETAVFPKEDQSEPGT